MVYRDIKEALNLTSMQVNSYYTVQTSSRHKVSYQLSGNRLTATGLAILTSICIIRYYCSYTSCRSTLASVSHNQQLHQILIYRLTGRLDNKNIFSTNTFTNHDLNLTIVEMANLCINQRNIQILGNLLC